MTTAYQHVYEGAGAPTYAPGSIGAHYTNTDNGDQYLAKGTASEADWELQEKAGAGAAAVSAHEQAANPHSQYAASAAPAAAVAAHTQEADPHTQYQQKEAGKGLSSNDYTASEKAKLAALEGSHFKGAYVDLSALTAAVPAPAAGDYADVDAGAGSEVVRHVWDATDSAWKPQLGASAQLTAAQVKALYESNADTNAYTDAEKAKLEGLGSGGAGLSEWAESSTLTAAVLAPTGAEKRDAVIAPIFKGALRAAEDGNDRGMGAVDLQTLRDNDAHVASGDYSVISGGYFNQATGYSSFIGGGGSNFVEGTSGSVGGGDSNSVSGNYGSIAGGTQNAAGGSYASVGGGLQNHADGEGAFVGAGGSNNASGSYSVIGGGYGCIASSDNVTIAGGEENQATNWYATVGGGSQNQATGRSSTVPGGAKGTTRGIRGAMAYGGYGGATIGASQIERHVLRKTTTDATATPVSADGGIASAENQVVLPDNSAYMVRINIVARSAAGDVSAWEITGLVRRDAGVGTVAVVSSPTVTMLAQTAGASSWSVAMVGNTSLGALGVQVTGAAVQISWVAEVQTVEVVM